MSCMCNDCLKARQITMIQNYGNDAAKKQLIDELLEEIQSLYFDIDYLSAIIDGSWPQADDIISLRRAK